MRRQATATEAKGTWTPDRVRSAAVLSLAAPVVLLAILHFVVGEGPRGPATAAATAEVPAPAPAPPLSAVNASAAASATSAASAEPVVTADAGEPVAAADAGAAHAAGADGGTVDPAQWKQMLRGTAVSSDWKRGAEAILVLSQQAPEALGERNSIDATATIAARIEAQDPPLANQVFDALGSTGPGLDVLYRLVSVRGGSVAAERAAKMLAQPEVRTRATPALRAALELREAPCNEKEDRADRAAADGDHRALAILLQLKAPSCSPATDGCCVRDSARVDAAVKAITQRERAPQP